MTSTGQLVTQKAVSPKAAAGWVSNVCIHNAGRSPAQNVKSHSVYLHQHSRPQSLRVRLKLGIRRPG